MVRRLIWSVGIGVAYLVVNGKRGYDTASELFVTGFVGAVIVLLLSYASEKPTSISSARLKLAFWPGCLILFWTYLAVYPSFDLVPALWCAAVGGGAGLVIGSTHFLITRRRLKKKQSAL